MPFHTCHSAGGGSSHHRRRNDLDRMFDGTIIPSESAYQDLFVLDVGIDKNDITLSNTETEVVEESRDEECKVQVHTVLYKGQEIWRVEPTTNVLDMQQDNQDDVMEEQQHSSKQRYHSTCVLLKDAPQLEITIESTMSPVASDEEVLDEIATAPTSIWCNTTAAINETSPYAPGVIFRESRKINVENLIRAAAEEHQRLIAVPKEREATVVEYSVFCGSNANTLPNDGTKESEWMNITDVPKKESSSNKRDHQGVVKSTVSMASESSSVYLNQAEDDELSAQQKEAMNSFNVFNMNLFQMLDRA